MTKKISSFHNLKVAALLCAAKAAIPCGIAASMLEYRLLRILRMISTIRRINCFMTHAIPCGFLFYHSGL